MKKSIKDFMITKEELKLVQTKLERHLADQLKSQLHKEGRTLKEFLTASAKAYLQESKK